MKTPDTSRLEFDAKAHAYKLDGKLLQGVTSIIDGTSSKQNLIQWAADMAIKYVKENCEEKEDVGSGPAPDWVYHASEYVLEQARTAHTRRKESVGKKGTDTHALVEEYINECMRVGTQNATTTGEKWPIIHDFMVWSKDKDVKFIAAEQRLYSETHMYAGTCDFIAIIDGKLTIGDLKTFPKMWSADAFIQMGAYSLAWKELTGQAPEQSVVVKMCDPEDERLKKYGGKAFSVYPRYALAEDEEMFLTRLKMYRYNQAFVSPKE